MKIVKILFSVVADTTKVRIFKQITTVKEHGIIMCMLLLIPQRYEFSSKSQLQETISSSPHCCCWYHKGTNFQANHNKLALTISKLAVVADTTKVRIFKQITTRTADREYQTSCCWYHKGTNFQANHNGVKPPCFCTLVVADTTKVRIFKQITTTFQADRFGFLLLLIPQRYEFSSKSQRIAALGNVGRRCCWYHKGTNFQANHNYTHHYTHHEKVVADTTKVRIFKQITTSLKH